MSNLSRLRSSLTRRARAGGRTRRRHLSQIAFERPHQVEILARRRRHVRLTEVGEKLKDMGAILAPAGRTCNAAARSRARVSSHVRGHQASRIFAAAGREPRDGGVSQSATSWAHGLLAALIDEAAREPKLRDKRADRLSRPLRRPRDRQPWRDRSCDGCEGARRADEPMRSWAFTRR